MKMFGVRDAANAAGWRSAPFESNGPKGRRPLSISAFAPAADHTILNHLRGRHSQVAKATVCKTSPRNLVRVRKDRKANAGPLPPFSLLVRRGQERTSWDSHVVPIRSQGENRRDIGAAGSAASHSSNPMLTHIWLHRTIYYSLSVMRHTILLSIVAIAAFTGCGRPTTTATTPPKAKTTNWYLDICGDKKIQNPTESDIRQAVFALDTKEDDAFLILGPTEMTYIQTTGDQKFGFVLEYQETDAKHHYRAKRNLTADEIVKALVSYSTGADDWKTMAEWELIRW